MDLQEKNGKLEQLEAQIKQLLADSRDSFFTQYLYQLSQRLIQQKHQADLLQDELDRSYRLYRQRMKLEDAEGRETETEGPEAEAEAGKTAAEEPQQTLRQEISREAHQNPRGDRDSQRNGAYTSAAVWIPPAPAPAPKSNGEFAVGAVLLSILGGAFILTALVMLGINYMNGFVRGMALYGIAASVVLISEALVYRKWKALGSTLSAIGIGGLYLSTVINYLALRNFPLWTAMLITLGIMLFVILLSRKRDSAMYRILGLIACYLCFLTIEDGISERAFFFVVGMAFAANLMCALIPVRKYKTEVSVVHIVSNALFAQILLWRASWCGLDAPVPRMVFFLSVFAVAQLVYILEVKRRKENTEGICVAYGITAVLYFFQFCFEIGNMGFAQRETEFIGLSLAGLAAVCVPAFLVLWKHREKWFVYAFLSMAILLTAPSYDLFYAHIFYLALLLITKLFTLKKPQALLLKLTDGVLTAVVCLEALYLQAGGAAEMTWPGSGMMLAGVILSILFINYWHGYYQLLLTYTTAFYLSFSVPPMMKLPIFTGVLFLGILAFNNVKRWRGNRILLFNGFALSGQIICFLLLLHPVYRNSYLTYLSMLVFGLATIVLTFREGYRMNFQGNSMITAVFLTYMALIVKLPSPIVNSIFIMLIALLSVGAGFFERKKSIRIYGLVLSLIVCGKMVLYDFMGAPTLQKTILFFAVGVIALVIAGIYIVLEKKTGAND